MSNYCATTEQVWSFTLPPTPMRGQRLQLLTIGGVSVFGNWYGKLGEFFVAWAPILQPPPTYTRPNYISPLNSLPADSNALDSNTELPVPILHQIINEEQD